MMQAKNGNGTVDEAINNCSLLIIAIIHKSKSAIAITRKFAVIQANNLHVNNKANSQNESTVFVSSAVELTSTFCDLKCYSCFNRNARNIKRFHSAAVYRQPRSTVHLKLTACNSISKYEVHQYRLQIAYSPFKRYWRHCGSISWS